MSCLWCLGFCYKPDSLSPVSTPKNKNNLEEVKLFFILIYIIEQIIFNLSQTFRYKS